MVPVPKLLAETRAQDEKARKEGMYKARAALLSLALRRPARRAPSCAGVRSRYRH